MSAALYIYSNVQPDFEAVELGNPGLYVYTNVGPAVHTDPNGTPALYSYTNVGPAVHTDPNGTPALYSYTNVGQDFHATLVGNPALYQYSFPTVTPPCATLVAVTPNAAEVGDAVVISGYGLLGGTPEDPIYTTVRLYESADHNSPYIILPKVSFSNNLLLDFATVTIPEGAKSGFVSVVHTEETCPGGTFKFLTILGAAEPLKDEGWWIEAWSLDSLTRKVSDVPALDSSFTLGVNGIGIGTLTVPAGYSRLDEIIVPDPRDDEGTEQPAVSSLIKVFLHGALQYSFFADKKRWQIGEHSTTGGVVVSGPGVEGSLSWGLVIPPESDQPQDMLYGSFRNAIVNGSAEDPPELITNGDFESGYTEPWDPVEGGSVTSDDTVARTGARSLRVEVGATRNFRVTPSHRVLLSAHRRVGTGTGDSTIVLSYKDEDDNTVTLATDTTTLTTTWTVVKLQATVPPGVTSLTVTVTADLFWLDDVSGVEAIAPWEPVGGATIALDDTVQNTGKYSFKISGPQGSGMRQQIRVAPSTKYRATIPAFGAAGDLIRIEMNVGPNALRTEAVLAAGQFNVFTLSGTTRTDQRTATITITNETAAIPNETVGGGTFWADDMSALPGEPPSSGGKILADAIAAAQAHGYLPLHTTDFTDDQDSNGQPWDEPNIAVVIRRGSKVSDVANTLASFGLEWWVSDRFVVSLANKRGNDLRATGLTISAVDKGVVDQAVSPVNAVYAEAADGSTDHIKNQGDIDALGQRGRYLLASGVLDASTLAVAARTELDNVNSRRTALNVTVEVLDDGGLVPLRNFNMGDTALVDISKETADGRGLEKEKYPEGFRLRSVTVNLSKAKPQYILDLNWVVLEAAAARDAALQLLLSAQRVASIAPGSVSVGNETGGAVVYAASAEHTHEASEITGLPVGLAEGAPATGDLLGAYPDPLVRGWRGHPIVATPPTVGDMHYYDEDGTWRYVSGSRATGYIPSVAADGSIAWGPAPVPEPPPVVDPVTIPKDPFTTPPAVPHPDDDEFNGESGTLPLPWAQVFWNDPSADVQFAESGGGLSWFHNGQLLSDRDATGVMKPLPAAAPLTIETAMSLGFPDRYTAYAGLTISGGASYGTGKQVVLGVSASATNATRSLSEIFIRLAEWNQWSDRLRFESDYEEFAHGWVFLRLVWVAGGEFKALVSADGVVWTEYLTLTMAAGFTPTHYGLFYTPWRDGHSTAGTFKYFRVYNEEKVQGIDHIIR